MKITLRKANALQNAIQDHIKTIDLKMVASLNEFQDPGQEIEKARSALIDGDKRRADLTTALYAIRGQVGNANVQSGISNELARAAYIDKRLGHLKGLTESSATEDMEVVKGKLKKLSETESKNRMYGYSDTVAVGVLTTEQIAQFKGDVAILKKEKQSINDKVLELNIRTEIDLTEDVVSILRSEQLV